MNIVLLGPPASGKGTQGVFLQKKMGFISICAGDLLRLEVQKSTPLGIQIKNILDNGGLVDDHLISILVGKQYALVHSSPHVIFDGYPRSVRQALDLELLLISTGKQVDAVLYFDINVDTLIERVSGRYTCADCGQIYHKNTKPSIKPGVCDACNGQKFFVRDDDNPEILSKRVGNFYKTTQPVVEFYKGKKNIYSIDASQSYDVVSEQIKEIVNKKIKGEF
jgi:adenylate kinase